MEFAKTIINVFKLFIYHQFFKELFSTFYKIYQSRCFRKVTCSRIENALPKRPPPLGGGAPPSPSQICQLSAIMADYWPPLAPRPASLATRRERVPPSFPPVQETGDVAPSPRMVSDFQSEPIRAIGGRLKIRGHPGPASASSPIEGDGNEPKVQTFRGWSPPKVCTFGWSFWAENSPAGAGSPIRITGSPTSPSAAAADGSGNLGRQLGEACFPSCFPPVSVAFRSSSTLPSMSCLEIRVGDPNF